MFNPISKDEFIKDFLDANTGFEEGHIRKALDNAIKAKQDGVLCRCGQLIWAAGSAVAGNYACYTCITGEADNSDDFEIDSVCERKNK